MIEVSLYSVPEGSDVNISMGRCVDRTRFDKEKLGVGVLDFTKGFLKTNLGSIEHALNNSDLVGFINSDHTMTAKDLACINYYLAKVGYIVKIQNVADDEDNPLTVPAESAEWNIVDSNFMQYGYPTATKIIPASGTDVVAILKEVVEQSDLFDTDKIGTKNPLKGYIEQLEKIKNELGRIEPGVASKIYDILSQVGYTLFLATGE